MRDKRSDAERVLLERIRRMTPAKRFEEGLRASVTCRHVNRAGIRARHPEYSDDENALARTLWGARCSGPQSPSRRSSSHDRRSRRDPDPIPRIPVACP